uniref:Mediator of RNA polymerase II transcription subunit 6 n=1 Tax=Bos indicus x Bos taurus TaxID=30522 RepID=A0A4W2H963_BOBOX
MFVGLDFFLFSHPLSFCFFFFKDNLLGISWVDSSWIPILNSGSVLDYFSERSNPFYDRTCNNEVVKMQRLTLEHLNQMVGVEYILLHAQEPILFIIRKQQRQSPTQVIPLADYYIIAGVIYQAPDLGSVINSRVLTAVHGIQSAFDEAMSYCRYHPSKGYWWHFKDHEEQDKVKPKVKRKEEPSSIFQRQRVDALLLDLRQKFPPKFVQVLEILVFCILLYFHKRKGMRHTVILLTLAALLGEVMFCFLIP